jgi:hypothetical protein
MNAQMPVLRNDLRRALEAISTTTYEMQMAGIRSVPELGLSRQDVHAIWSAMLSTALRELKEASS